ncbi:ABC transporter permease [Pandoraea eparura]|uniref:ABC transporter permease n=1 Tax=Pandoraea eparura TaxID=2508291 RepID=A0A5E4U4H3_9BURK|nr:branched-chain amino acid ABC transporter permease [Pandoraea eparura]VVD95037.1 ABC transporter permease [Pandoraea eparura]
MSKSKNSTVLATVDISRPPSRRRCAPTMTIVAFVLFAAALIVPMSMTWLKTPVIFAASLGIAALGVSILIRAGQVSFGHAMFSCLAGYAVAFISRWWAGLDSAVLIVCGTVFGTFCGLVIGLFVARYREIFFGMLNLALSMVLFAVLGKLFDFTGGTDGLQLPKATFLGMALERDGLETALLIFTMICALAASYFVSRYVESAAGKSLSAIKTNETRLEYVGISTYRTFLTGYVLSAALCSLSGAIFAVTQGLVTPEMGYWVRSGELVFVAILGGVVHPVGAFLGATIFEFVKLFAAAYLTDTWQMVLGGVLIFMVFFAPMGISGLLVRFDASRGNGARQ